MNLKPTPADRLHTPNLLLQSKRVVRSICKLQSLHVSFSFHTESSSLTNDRESSRGTLLHFKLRHKHPTVFLLTVVAHTYSCRYQCHTWVVFSFFSVIVSLV
jgi:hypothetical protein